MPIRRYSFHEHDLTLLIVSGKHTSTDIIRCYQSMDATFATRWLKYLDPTVDMSRVDLANVSTIRRVKREKLRELFGDKLKPVAIAFDSEPAEQFFIEFWQRYTDSHERCFRSLDEAYNWLGLSEAARAVVARAIAGGDADTGARRT